MTECQKILEIIGDDKDGLAILDTSIPACNRIRASLYVLACKHGRLCDVITFAETCWKAQAEGGVEQTTVNKDFWIELSATLIDAIDIRWAVSATNLAARRANEATTHPLTATDDGKNPHSWREVTKKQLVAARMVEQKEEERQMEWLRNIFMQIKV
jgi:hypothetical protein